MCGMNLASIVSFGRSLPRLLLGAANEEELLDGLAAAVSHTVMENSGTRVDCALFLRRPKRALAYGASSRGSKAMGLFEQALASGLVDEALRESISFREENLQASTRWPAVSAVSRTTGFQSLLSAPVELSGPAGAVFVFFREAKDIDTNFLALVNEVLAECSAVLQLAVELLAAQHHIQDLTAAMETRSVIDTACGVIMAQNRCSHDEAFDLLVSASKNRNEKLHAVSLRLLQGASGPPGTRHFNP